MVYDIENDRYYFINEKDKKIYQCPKCKSLGTIKTKRKNGK